jgi:phosphoribosylaminoimidazole-succinocarboxamide synthase
MAEVQTNTQSGEMSQRFIEFVMMQAQNAALFLGQIPNPQTGKGEVNLELAKMFIDQLAMIQEKTRGNLTNEETTVLRNTLSNLQMAFVEVSRQVPEGTTESDAAPETPEAEADEPAAPPSAEKAEPPATPASESESRKKFTKSYGA